MGHDPQAAYLLLLMSGSTRANFLLRTVRPDLTEEFAIRHDSAVWRCLCTILGTPSAPMDAQVLASLSFSGGGLGLASAHRVRTAAHFASWADSLIMVRKRHPHIAATMIRNLEVGTSPSFGHHRAACPEAGVLGKRGFPLECAAAQVCRECEARVSTNVFVRDMDLAVHNGLDSRRPGSGCGRVDTLAGSSTRHRHNNGVTFTPGRDSQLDEGRKPPTLNFPVTVGERASLSWQPKWAGGGVRRRHKSSLHWRKLEPRRCPWSCKAGPRQLR